MRIYIVHPTNMDYQKEIYGPLKNDDFFLEHELILPHEKSAEISNARDDYKNVDLVIAECSQPSIGVGIELGWFYDDEKPIYGFYKSGAKISNAVNVVAKKIIEYQDAQDLIDKIKNIILTEFYTG